MNAPDRSGPRRRRPRRAPCRGRDRRCVARPEAPAHLLEGARRDRLDRGQGGRAGDRRNDRVGVSGPCHRGRGKRQHAGSERRLAVPLDHRSARRHDELRPRLPVLRRVDRARARQRADARGRARPGPRRALHRDQGTRRAAQQRADPHVGLHAHAGCADRHRRPDAEEPAAAAATCRSSTRSPRAARCGARAPARSTWPTSRRAGSTASSR